MFSRFVPVVTSLAHSFLFLAKSHFAVWIDRLCSSIISGWAFGLPPRLGSYGMPPRTFMQRCLLDTCCHFSSVHARGQDLLDCVLDQCLPLRGCARLFSKVTGPSPQQTPSSEFSTSSLTLVIVLRPFAPLRLNCPSVGLSHHHL